MARARGFASVDRKELIGTLTAVLQRQPGALAWARAELERLRSRAAEDLAFELAGRIHTEIGALDWVTCPQRVTIMDAGDFDVYGWSGDVLKIFNPGSYEAGDSRRIVLCRGHEISRGWWADGGGAGPP
jgi:hypothetical protein